MLLQRAQSACVPNVCSILSCVVLQTTNPKTKSASVPVPGARAVTSGNAA